VLAGLAAEYIRPWQKRQASPHHLYSRVGPRFIPSISSTVEIASGDLVRSDNFLMATVTIDKGAEPERIPCVVGRKTADVHFFAENRWLTQAAWLERAPLP